MSHKNKAVSVLFVLILLMGALAFGSTASAAESEQRSQFVTPIMVVNTSFLNVRTGPGAQYTVLITVVGGTELPVLGVARDMVWYQVSTAAGVGWVNSQFVLPRGDFTNVPFAAAPAVVDDPAALGQGGGGPLGEDAAGPGFVSGRAWGVSVIATHPARSQPTINSASVGTASENLGEIYSLIESRSNEGQLWLRLEIPSLGSVWVEGTKTRFRPFACGADISAVVMNGFIAPNQGPDGSGTLTGNLQVGPQEEAYLLDLQAGQYKVELIDGNTGWIPREAATVRSNVRSRFCEMGGMTTVAPTTLGQGGGAVTTPGQQTGARLTVPRAVINTGFLNLRSGPGAQFSVVSTLPGGTELPIVGVAPDGVWYLVEGTFGQAWLNSDFVLFRGDGRNIPVIRDATGATLSRPVALVTNAVTLFTAPNPAATVIGAVSGPLEAPIVARTEDASWLQLTTPLGFGWVRADQVNTRGDLATAPIIR